MSLKDKICVVTGAAGVLCSALVEALLEEGAKVALLGRTESKLIDLKNRLADKGYDQTLVVAADVLDPQSLKLAKESINKNWGPVYLLVNGAGGNHPKATAPAEQMGDDTAMEDSFFGLDADAYSQVFDLNFKGSFIPAQIFGEDMIEVGEGNIINISSMSASRPLTKVGAYSNAKAAVDSFTQWLSVHLAEKNIRVNAIAPGFFVSDQNRFLLYEQDGETLTARGQKIINNTPMHEFGEPEDLKGSMKFLAGPGSRFITGIVLPVDGGFSAFSGV
ncbi:D-mannonate oxidoreductase [Lentisphaera araneosa HTCC2155]|uniref:D-mannonate oxidoreductase n=1 Tax=Lentisphaera araneosa HTCC2155 TaxID=313628 RepID=A6DP75_9BACT|nr:SDR family oxidoreductase [Lentisphaera araneosa]EDM26607.1 D-mannonate oxidoreductase [Lentisphaera araneosa HTCC2155]